MISSTQAQRQITELDQKLTKMEKALADCQTKYEKGQQEYAKLVTYHLGNLKEPQSLRTQERTLHTLMSKIEALQQSIYLHQSQREDLEKQLLLADIYESQARPYLEAEERFTGTGEALALAIGELQERIVAFNRLVEHFLSNANAPLQLLYNLVVDASLAGVSLESYIREGKFEESDNHSEFMTDIGATYKDIAERLPLLHMDTISELERSCRIIQDWVGFTKRGDYEQLVRRGITFTPQERLRSDVHVQPAITTQVVRMPLAPPVDEKTQRELDQIQRHRVAVKTVNANRIIRSSTEE